MGLDSTEIVVELEDTFAIRIPDEDAERCRTPRDIAGVCCRQMEASGTPWPKGASGVDRDQVMLRVRRVIGKVMRIPVEQVTPDANLVKDLGLG